MGRGGRGRDSRDGEWAREGKEGRGVICENGEVGERVGGEGDCGWVVVFVGGE